VAIRNEILPGVKTSRIDADTSGGGVTTLFLGGLDLFNFGGSPAVILVDDSDSYLFIPFHEPVAGPALPAPVGFGALFKDAEKSVII
jgi:hypothetical protein